MQIRTRRIPRARYLARAASPGAADQDESPPVQEADEPNPQKEEEKQEAAAEEGDETEVALTDESNIVYTKIEVTGTVIRETPIDTPNSVATISRESLDQQGSPSVVDLFKNLSVSGGVIGAILPGFAAGKVGERFVRSRLTLFMAVTTIYAKLMAAWEVAAPA